jgi:hypothetical protein
MPHRSPRPHGLPASLHVLPHARPGRASGLRAGVAALAMGCLASACQVPPLGSGLMDGPPPVAGAAGPAPGGSTPAPAPAAASANAAGPSAPAQAPAVPGLLDMLDRPAERALLVGLRAYDDGQYPDAETQLRRAIDGNLRSIRDRGAARKMLAFIYCTTGRLAQCEAEFRAALRDDPSFALSRGEAGHPMWGPVYKRVKPQ